MAQQAVRVSSARSQFKKLPESAGHLPRRRALRLRPLPLLFGLVLICLWYGATRGTDGTSFVIASPEAVLAEYGKLLGNGTLPRHFATTLAEIGIGFAFGVSAAFALGYLIAKNRVLERTLGPYAVGFQAVPIIAITPILTRAFGAGLMTNGVICGLVVFFPMLISTIVGIRGVDPDLRDLMRALSATRWQVFARLEVPAALPSLFGGLKVSATLAVVGAVVAESFGANAGLGFLIFASRYNFNPAGVLVAIFTLTALALALYEVVARIERRMLAWQQAGH